MPRSRDDTLVGGSREVREPPANLPNTYRPLPQRPQPRHETGVPHRRLAYQYRVGACIAQAPCVFGTLDAALGDEGGAGKLRGEAFEGAEVNGEVPEVAVVDPDDARARFEGEIRLFFVVDLHERREADLHG